VAATLKPGWVLGEPPVEGAYPTYYFDNGNADLEWVIPSQTEGYTLVPGGEIPWPFVEEWANATDLVRLGFYDLEDIPS